MNVHSIWIAYIRGRLKKVSADCKGRQYNCTSLKLERKYYICLFFPVSNNLRFGHKKELEMHAKLHTCILPTKWKKKKERKKKKGSMRFSSNTVTRPGTII